MSDYMDFLGNLRNNHRAETDENASPVQVKFPGKPECADKPTERELYALPEEDGENREKAAPQPGQYSKQAVEHIKRVPSKKRYILVKKTVSTAKQETQDDSDMTVVDKYTDRFEAEPEKIVYSDGKTKQIPAYSDIRASEAHTDGKTRQISVAELKEAGAESSDKTIIITEDDKASLLRAIAQSATEDYEGEQLVMPGFAGKKEDERTPDEVELDEKLSAVRKERIKKFKLTGTNYSGGTLSGEQLHKNAVPVFLKGMASAFEKYNTDFSPCEGDEFTDLAQRRRIFSGLVKVRRKNLLRILAVGAIGLALLLTNIIAAATASPAGALTVFGGNAMVYTAFNLVLFLVVCGICFDELKKGFISILQIYPKVQGAAALLSLAVIAQCIGAFITKKSLASEIQLFTGAAALLFVPLLYAKVFCYDNARHCFKAISSGGEKSVVRRSTPGNGISGLAGGNDEDSSVIYEGKTAFITRFLERASRTAYAGMPSSRLIIASCFASMTAGVIAAAVEKSPVAGLSVLTDCMCFSFPISGLFASTLLISKKNAKLSASGSYVQSFADARDLANSDYVAVDAHELFTVSLRDVTAFSGLNEKQAAYCAAALAMKAGGTLGQAFEKKYGAYKEKLPVAQELSYEEKLGLSAWMNNCRMLLGTRRLLENHNVKMPSRTVSDSFSDGGTQCVYMSIEERLAAIISLDYNCNAALSEKLKKLVSSGMSIIVFSCDANITEHMVESKLDLPENSVRVAGSLVYSEFESAKNEVSPGENTGIVFRGGFAGLCDCAVNACSLDRMKRLSKIICAGGCIAGILISAMIAISKTIGTASSLHVIIMQCAMLLITTVLCGVADSIEIPRRCKQRTASAEAEPEPQSESEEKNTVTAEKGGFTGDIFKGLLTPGDEPKDIFPEL